MPTSYTRPLSLLYLVLMPNSSCGTDASPIGLIRLSGIPGPSFPTVYSVVLRPSNVRFLELGTMLCTSIGTYTIFVTNLGCPERLAQNPDLMNSAVLLVSWSTISESRPSLYTASTDFLQTPHMHRPSGAIPLLSFMIDWWIDGCSNSSLFLHVGKLDAYILLERPAFIYPQA